MPSTSESPHSTTSGIVPVVGFYYWSVDAPWLGVVVASLVTLLLAYIGWRLMKKIDD
ncbi:MAG: hypothetical protein KDB90_03325 [Planctomycetes bacterium]|nr:hypothetical protein [Planctomycetota bacterium]